MTDIELDTGLPEESIPSDRIEVGQWYWVPEKGGAPGFMCAVHVGSNYVEFEDIWGHSRRVHFDDFEGTLEKNPAAVIGGEITERQAKLDQLMNEVREKTARLGVAPSSELEAGGGTQALVKATEGQSYGDYKTALVKAKKTDLPALFKEIEETSEAMARWMKAQLIPFRTQASSLKKAMGAIEDRIFNVDLYAGLSEQVVQITEGEPADLTEKVHLHQRRCYMDEECLAQYETGGMNFKDLKAFDRWMAKPQNRDRLLPHPRCVVAFRIRRGDKNYEIKDFIQLFEAIEGKELDKLTFLYIRNGDALYRMSTEIDFGEKLFPDLNKVDLGSEQLWAEMFAGSPKRIITQGEYDTILKEHAEEVAKFKKADKAYRVALKSPEAYQRAREKGRKEPDASCVDVPYPGFEPRLYKDFQPFNSSSVYYDDMSKQIADDIKAHNRIALILQGLLDRSPVFHPHPPWRIWENAGFKQALELVYDDSRALVAGEKPDFEAYRKRLNSSLKAGSVTVGQHKAWMRVEADKENERTSHRGERFFRHEFFKPYGNPGPGDVAIVESFKPRSRQATFAWERERQHPLQDWGLSREQRWAKIPTKFTCSAEVLLNVSAYTPGDFKQFFNDPRTRAEYLKWAPYLLAAEEYHARKST